MRSRALLFDFGGTLDADGLRWSVRFHAAYVAGAGRVGADEFEPIFRASDQALAAWPGIEGLAAETSRRVQRHDVGVVIGDVPQVRGRVQQGDDAARGVARTGTRAVQPPPGPGLQELRHEARLCHKERC